MNATNLTNDTTETLLMYWANANETYNCCGGHKKADRNKAAMVAYEKVLQDRGVTPSERIAGIFNGPGSH